ncbi:type I-B CRISPR-associated protein Cas7/Csh2 [Haloferax profundi]|uniref:Type I-B CRISPR-associated protein Cas7/Csh2 n=1 Tax=Haloferax profundi TaxID=1544718 RepID=A0A0W1SW69_9EURY|nr:type I-B CRISPR-associated protein Cas7/Csh2 [Haloferax profundi]KTG30658.1 hypothetical protein AUR66_00550 [Haloferax profundi]
MSSLNHRSEILFVTDASDCNPNGNPKAGNKPRLDPKTGQAIITDVRLKRYLRDQLQDDGHGILVKRTGDDTPLTQAEVALEAFSEIESVEDVEAVDSIRDEFVNRLADVRYFGAVLSFVKSNHDDVYQAILERFPRSFTGPVQFSPARSLNEVELNEGFDTLTSIMATQEGKSAGAFGLGDYRIAYGVFPFTGIVDPQRARETNLSEEDVRRLDTLCWRAIKNQTVSRSKFGQEPQLYLRVEYTHPEFHIGRLDELLKLTPTTDETIRSPSDYHLNIEKLVSVLTEYEGMIEAAYCVGSPRITLRTDDSVLGSAANLADILTEQCGIETVGIDVYEEYSTSLPDRE